MPGLLSDLIDPAQGNGLMSFAANLAQRGHSPGLKQLGGAYQATREQMQAQQEYARKQKLQGLQDQVIKGYGDESVLRQIGILSPEALAQVLGRALMPTSEQLPAADLQYLNRINQDRAAKGQPPIGLEDYIKDYKQNYGTSSQVVQLPDGTFSIISTGNRAGVNSTNLPGAPAQFSETLQGRIEYSKTFQRMAAELEGTFSKQAIDAKDTLVLLDSAEKLLKQRPTASGTGAVWDAAAGFFGVADAGADTAATLDIVAAKLLSKVPRFEGPQSDKDIDQYRAASGRLNDRTLPVNVRMAALNEMRELAKRQAKNTGASDPLAAEAKRRGLE